MSQHGNNHGDRWVMRHKRAPAPQAVAADATTAIVGAAQPVTLDTATVAAPAAATAAADGECSTALERRSIPSQQFLGVSQR